jgi:hypothetical protein
MNQAATSQATSYQQQYDHLKQHLTVADKAPDHETVTRILSARPKTPPKGSLQTTKPFSLLR